MSLKNKKQKLAIFYIIVNVCQAVTFLIKAVNAKEKKILFAYKVHKKFWVQSSVKFLKFKISNNFFSGQNYWFWSSEIVQSKWQSTYSVWHTRVRRARGFKLWTCESSKWHVECWCDMLRSVSFTLHWFVLFNWLTKKNMFCTCISSLMVFHAMVAINVCLQMYV